MRNLLITAAAGGGAWGMIHLAMQWGARCAFQSGLDTSAAGGLFVVPAAVVGALCAALVSGVLLPRF